MTAQHAPGVARLAFCRGAQQKTVLAVAYATSPVRILTPKNHGDAAWIFLASLGGGFVDGDRVELDVDVAADSSAFVATQASTKVYRSPSGCSQRLTARVARGAALAIVPDPVVCFAGARYEQRLDVDLEPGASVVVVDGYTCGRSARGERWAFSHYASRTTIARAGAASVIDSALLDPRHGPIGVRMGHIDAIVTLFAVGPRYAQVRDAMLASATAAEDGTIAAASPIGDDGCVMRVASRRFEGASRTLRPSFAALARTLGDDPFARKW